MRKFCRGHHIYNTGRLSLEVKSKQSCIFGFSLGESFLFFANMYKILSQITYKFAKLYAFSGPLEILLNVRFYSSLNKSELNQILAQNFLILVSCIYAHTRSLILKQVACIVYLF